jgi:preprotein translocase subunit SecD
MNWKRNWRIYLLVALVVLSGLALFVPGGDGGGAGTATDGNATGVNATDADAAAASDGMTNLQFGLELSGGTRLRAGLVGMTAENVEFSGDQVDDVEDQLAGSLDLDLVDVMARPADNTIEIYTENVTEEEFRTAVESLNVDTSSMTIREGVTQQTWESARNTLRDKINQGGLTGGTASIITSPTGERFVVVEVPNANRTEVLDLIGDPGRVQVVAAFPQQVANGTEQRRVPLLTQGDFRRIGQPERGQGQQPPFVRVTLHEGEVAQNFSNAMNSFGFTGQGVNNCRWRQNREEPGWCLMTVVDGEVTYAASMSPDLADSFRTGNWVNDPVILMQSGNFSDVQELKLNLEAGALPTELDIQSQIYLQPSLAQKFKPLALLTGIIAWLTVSAVIFYRYREIRVAIPMLLTAFAEVWILLGFAVAVGLALDLSHIAGLIAVIGTGVDDLVIIADEIMQRGEIATDRVFKNRFRKAFWVIGAAAITTIIAMSPLAVLSLGDLQGFAIVTIVGVLIGVLITRPAYGDILRNLLLGDQR